MYEVQSPGYVLPAAYSRAEWKWTRGLLCIRPLIKYSAAIFRDTHNSTLFYRKKKTFLVREIQVSENHRGCYSSALNTASGCQLPAGAAGTRDHSQTSGSLPCSPPDPGPSGIGQGPLSLSLDLSFLSRHWRRQISVPFLTVMLSSAETCLLLFPLPRTLLPPIST